MKKRREAQQSRNRATGIYKAGVPENFLRYLHDCGAVGIYNGDECAHERSSANTVITAASTAEVFRGETLRETNGFKSIRVHDVNEAH